MTPYSINVTPHARQGLDKVPKENRGALERIIRELADNPRPPGSMKLSGLDLYRVRKGNFRILYDVNDAGRVVTIIKIGDRKDVYKRKE